MATAMAKRRAATSKTRSRPLVKPHPTPRATFGDNAMLGDVLERLGGIPASRVRLYPTPGTATIRDLRRLDRRTHVTCELIDGVIVKKAMGWYESMLATELSTDLNLFVRETDSGKVLGADGTLRFLANQVRAADVCFIGWDRFPEGRLPTEDAMPRITPDLAVEVLSKGNTRREMERKLREYFEAGVSLVWIIDPKRRQASIYTSPTERTIIDEKSGVLDGGAVLPGFRVKLKELFARVDASKDRR